MSPITPTSQGSTDNEKRCCQPAPTINPISPKHCAPVSVSLLICGVKSTLHTHLEKFPQIRSLRSDPACCLFSCDSSLLCGIDVMLVQDLPVTKTL